MMILHYKHVYILLPVSPTFSHGLEVHFATEASKSSNSPSPNLKGIDRSRLQVSYDCIVGLTPC